MSDHPALKKWQDLPPGGVVVEGGNAKDYETGTWRAHRPVWSREHCVHCLRCWVFCPEEAIQLADGKTPAGRDRKEICRIDYFHCKGCGLCAHECPVNKKGVNVAIAYVLEQT